jgi:hypothetical protein
MKHIQIALEDKEYRAANAAKGESSWKEFLMSGVPGDHTSYKVTMGSYDKDVANRLFDAIKKVSSEDWVMTDDLKERDGRTWYEVEAWILGIEQANEASILLGDCAKKVK